MNGLENLSRSIFTRDPIAGGIFIFVAGCYLLNNLQTDKIQTNP